ncbi:MAG: hypothetical protein CVV06_02950 [Gammaproteobacteria bacterium HGW-Gammaproteobacteria-10]|nr:MAG: hypothetical protein CVV06_02950 [Gammaproteobacteria bacterium HGW-Gammaproteobacteria-10]
MNNQQKLAEREQLKSTAAANQRKQEALINQRWQLQQDIREAKNRYNGFSNSQLSNAKHSAEDAKRQVERLTADLEQVQSQIDELNRAIETDKATLAAFRIEVTPAEIIEQQNAIQEEQKKADDLERLQAEQRSIIETAQRLDDSAAPLKKRRGQLLAEAATGIDHAKQLADIESEITKAEQADHASNQTKIDAAGKAADTLAALDEMLSSKRQLIEAKQDILALLQDSYFQQMAVSELGKYQTAAQQAAESLQILAAIDKMIAQIGIRDRSGLLPNAARQVALPALGDMPQNGAYFYQRAVIGQADQPGIEALLSRLKAQGIEVEQ